MIQPLIHLSFGLHWERSFLLRIENHNHKRSKEARSTLFGYFYKIVITQLQFVLIKFSVPKTHSGAFVNLIVGRYWQSKGFELSTTFLIFIVKILRTLKFCTSNAHVLYCLMLQYWGACGVTIIVLGWEWVSLEFQVWSWFFCFIAFSS